MYLFRFKRNKRNNFFNDYFRKDIDCNCKKYNWQVNVCKLCADFAKVRGDKEFAFHVKARKHSVCDDEYDGKGND